MWYHEEFEGSGHGLVVSEWYEGYLCSTQVRLLVRVCVVEHVNHQRLKHPRTPRDVIMQRVIIKLNIITGPYSQA